MGEGNFGVDETDSRQAFHVLRSGERSCDAADIRPTLSAVSRRQVVFCDDVGNAYTSARHQDPEHLGQHGRLVGRQVDHAVGDHHIYCTVRQRDVLDGALQEFDVRGAGLGFVGIRQIQHLVSHVDSVGVAGRPDTSCRESNAASGRTTDSSATRSTHSERPFTPICKGWAMNDLFGQTTTHSA